MENNQAAHSETVQPKRGRTLVHHCCASRDEKTGENQEGKCLLSHHSPTGSKKSFPFGFIAKPQMFCCCCAHSVALGVTIRDRQRCQQGNACEQDSKIPGNLAQLCSWHAGASRWPHFTWRSPVTRPSPTQHRRARATGN